MHIEVAAQALIWLQAKEVLYLLLDKVKIAAIRDCGTVEAITDKEDIDTSITLGI